MCHCISTQDCPRLPAQWQLAKPPRIAQVCRARCTVPVPIWQGTTDALACIILVWRTIGYRMPELVMFWQRRRRLPKCGCVDNMRAGAYSSMGCRKLRDGMTSASATRMSPIGLTQKGLHCQPSSRVAILHLLRFQHLYLRRVRLGSGDRRDGRPSRPLRRQGPVQAPDGTDIPRLRVAMLRPRPRCSRLHIEHHDPDREREARGDCWQYGMELEVGARRNRHRRNAAPPAVNGFLLPVARNGSLCRCCRMGCSWLLRCGRRVRRVAGDVPGRVWHLRFPSSVTCAGPALVDAVSHAKIHPRSHRRSRTPSPPDSTTTAVGPPTG